MNNKLCYILKTISTGTQIKRKVLQTCNRSNSESPSHSACNISTVIINTLNVEYIAL